MDAATVKTTIRSTVPRLGAAILSVRRLSAAAISARRLSAPAISAWRLSAPLGLLAALALPRLAAACSTCYGAADSPMVKGQNYGILTLLGFVLLVYVGVGKVIWDFRRRARRHARPTLRVIHGGKH